MKTKTTYRVRNWGEYNAALVGRASVTFWIDATAVSGWLSSTRSGRRGASCLYSRGAIECVLVVASVYGLTLRGAQGFVGSIFALMGLSLPIPHFSTLCRRRQSLPVSLGVQAGTCLHLVVDGTGLKVYGEGEWKVRQHGWCKRRSWLNVQLGLDRDTQQIVATACRHNAHSDKSALPLVLRELDQAGVELHSVTGDGAYDARSCYEQIQARGAQPIIPPFRRAQFKRGTVYEARNAAVLRIRELQGQGHNGRSKWKEEVGYHKRSRIETTMMQLKTIFGDKVRARKLTTQTCEVRVRCKALNRMMSLGMPHSVAIPTTN